MLKLVSSVTPIYFILSITKWQETSVNTCQEPILLIIFNSEHSLQQASRVANSEYVVENKVSSMVVTMIKEN